MRFKTAVAAACLLLLATVAACAPAPPSLFDSWRARLEVVPASEADSNTFIQPGASVPPGHQVLLSGVAIQEVHIMRVQKRGTWLEIVLDPTGRDRFADITGVNMDRQLLFVIDGKVVSAPVILQPITTGHFAIPLDYATPTPGAPPPPILPQE
jgi:preprotein translocase subunit SecD